jgi:superfamily II DNA or RNA helicase/phage anti-repressor protein/predicted GIY-YIG superfamily endonuclease
METLLQQGTQYEIYVRDIIKEKYNNCWLWKDIPQEILFELEFIKDIKNKCDDIGCDLLAKTKDNTYEYIQCKNYSTLGIDNTISICDLSGFYNFVAENDIKTPIVYYSGVLSSQILCRKKKVKYINLPFIKISNEDIKPRDYQIEAFNLLDNVNRGILEMPCGTGKTLVSYLISLKYDNIILLSPLISTTEQLIKHYKNYYSKEKEPISFNLISSQHNRNIDNIELCNKNIIGSTFDSCDIINKLLNKLVGSVFIIIDECHNLSNTNITDKTDEINKLLLSNYKILFVSATPKNYRNEYDNIFGTIKYTLKWDEAIKNNYICDYSFYYPNNDKIIDHINNIKVKIDDLEKTILINKAFFLLETIKTIGITKCIVYLKSIEETNIFENVLKTINLYYNFSLAVYNINYSTGRTTRNASLTKFRNNSTKISIMLNVHILDEGIDIPECDSVYLTHPNNNPINIIQRISRANRISKDKKVANILVWSKTQEKLNDIIKRIETYISVKFSNINNEFINKNTTNNNDDKKNNLYGNNHINNHINNGLNIHNKLNKINIIEYLNNNNVKTELIKFVEDFYYEDNTHNNGFIIDLEVLTKWLGAKKATIKDTLKNSYTKNIDYSETIIRNGVNGRPSSSVMLTPDCMKRLCMVSRTKKAEDVRSYFIELEKHIDQYKDVIIERYLANHTPQQENTQGGVIYILNTDLNLPSVYKIGKTADFKARLKTHQSSHVDNIKVVKVYKTTDIDNVEKCLKQYLKQKQFKKYKEFYQVDVDDITKLFKICNNATLSAKKVLNKNEQKGGYYIYLEKD